jgi:2-polyprenyl-6-methoxyphenol hydroxylase-like FAD-dependent oxidoreductase
MKTDVVVVGGGPSGLTVASELALAGVDVVVLERRTSPVQSRAGTVLPRVLELLDSRGLAQRFIDRAAEIRENPLFQDHIWAGMRPVEWRHLGSRFGYRLILPQNHTEELLLAHAREQGVTILSGVTVESVKAGADDVVVLGRGADDGILEVQASYVVGADGGRSVVRQEARIGFAGHDATFTGIVADARIETPWPEGRRMVDNERGWVTSFPFGSDDEPITRFNIVHVDRRHAPQSEPVTLEEVRACLREILGFDIEIDELRWASRFTDAMRIADTFRAGRVLLVGESSRIHYPASGVGMNFCIQDAFNLGWKLAAVLNGHASEALLDTYEAERRPVAEQLLASVNAQCAVQFDFSPEGVAFKRMFQQHLMPMTEVNRRLALELNGLLDPYPSRAGSAGSDWHPLAGRPAPDLILQSPTGLHRLGEELRSQDLLLIDCTGHAAFSTLDFGDAPVRTLTGVASIAPETAADVSALLVRPDGYIAWATAEPASDTHAEHEVRAWLDRVQ